MLDIMDYYGRQRALCGGSLDPPWKIWGGHLPTPDPPPPQMAPLLLLLLLLQRTGRAILFVDFCQVLSWLASSNLGLLFMQLFLFDL